MSQPTPAWWQTAHWRQQLQQHLWVRSRRRFTLELSADPPLGATNPRQRLVHIQPEGIAFPTDRDTLAQIRHAPRSPRRFAQAMTWMLVEHESAHVRFSGIKPTENSMIGWMWNALEDQRIELLMMALYPELGQGFTMLGDAVWTQLTPTSDLLAGCLYHRFEHTRPARQWKFHPPPEEQSLWDTTILPLVQDAWHAVDSDTVTTIARAILHHLHRDAAAPPPDLGIVLCGCGGGGAHQHPDLPTPPQEPLPAGGFFAGTSAGAGKGTGHDPFNPAQDAPEALLAQVEGYARSMARDLHPPQQRRFARPHPSRGDLNLDRVVAGSQQPFDAVTAPGPARSFALMTLVDESGSMAFSGFMEAAKQVTMLLDRACELAGIPLGILGFDGQDAPIHIRPLHAGPDPVSRRRIAGMRGMGGTCLAPALRLAVQLLATTHAERKLIVLLHDGEPEAADWLVTEQLIKKLPQGIVLQPLYLGTDATIRTANERLFGHVLACDSLDALRRQVCAWLRALA